MRENWKWKIKELEEEPQRQAHQKNKRAEDKIQEMNTSAKENVKYK